MATPLRQCCSCTDGTISTNGYRHAADTISRPDLAHGWRFQVPLLLSLGCQVVLPDMLGYGQTSAPDSPVHYSLKNTTNHLAQLIHAVGGSSSSPVLVGAHDWGAMVAWRLVMYYPELVRAVFCFCVPFTPPQPTVEPLEDFVKKNPVFTYQLQNAGSEAEALAGQTPAHLQGFLNAMFGGVTEDGLPGFDPYVGLIGERLLKVQGSPLVALEIRDHYGMQCSRSSAYQFSLCPDQKLNNISVGILSQRLAWTNELVPDSFHKRRG
jgi:soluble epoxide hydrolase/lipid-phosphate phosphatase